MAAPPAAEGGATPATPASTTRGRLPWMAAAVGAIGMAAMAVPVVQHLRETPPTPPVLRFTIDPPNGVPLSAPPMISPDGTRVVFAAGGALFVRPLEALSAERLPGTEGATFPFWAPDSRSIGFFTERKLKKIDIAGGPAVTICDALNGRGGAWSQAGVNVFAPEPTGGLQQVSAAGGTPTPATIPDPTTAASHRWPQFLPDGAHFLYLQAAATGPTGIFVTSLGSKTITSLVSSNAQAQYAAPGALLFARGNTLMRQPFDAATLQLLGDPAPLAEDVAWMPSNIMGFSASHTGVLVYSTGQAEFNRRLVWVDRRGAATPLALAPGDYADPALSPDGRQIALTVRDATGGQIWVYDVARGTLGKRTFESSGTFPVWSRDGTLLTFTRLASPGALMRVRADGTGTAEPLITEAQLAGLKIATSSSAAGQLLAVQSGFDVGVRDAEGVIHPTLTTAAYEREGRFASDGRWLAYRSDETGRDEVYIQSYPPGNGKWQISADGGAQPMWASNDRDLFYQSGSRMMVVDIELGATLRAGTPRVLFEMRFLVLTTATGEREAASTPPVTVVFNYAPTLKR